MHFADGKYFFSIFILPAILLWFTGCIDPFTIGGAEEYGDMLVVDGIISDDTTYVTLSRSVPVSTLYIYGFPKVNDADVYVERSDGVLYPALDEVSEGKYKIPVDEFDAGLEYRLKIVLDGQTYFSEYKKPLITPEIDELSFVNDEEEKTLWPVVTSHDPADQSPYYMWSCDEIWESRAVIYSTVGFEPGTTSAEKRSHRRIEYYDPENGFYPPYYCWNYNTKYFWGTTENLVENSIQKTLVPISRRGRKLSQLYYLKVKQNQLSRDAYDYYSTILRNTNDMGSVFTPMPSEIEGNVYCGTDPSVTVIGYVDVSRTVWTETFITSPNEYYIAPNQPPCLEQRGSCVGCIVGLWVYDPSCPGTLDGCTIFDHMPDGQGSWRYIWTYKDCSDCRTWGTKDRPPWWPNDHY